MRAWLPVGVALVALGALGGCVSLKRTSEARFFALRPVAQVPEAPAAESGSSIVGVLPVFLPAYLQRPQFVTWSGPGEVRIDEFLRWTEPLDTAVRRVLVEDLRILLPSSRVIGAPWPASTPLRCRVRVELVRFGSQPGGETSLSGRVLLLAERSERALAIRVVDLRRDSVPGPNDPGRSVEAMSALLADLAAEIAQAVSTLPPDRSQTAASTGGAAEVPR